MGMSQAGGRRICGMRWGEESPARGGRAGVDLGLGGGGSGHRFGRGGAAEVADNAGGGPGTGEGGAGLGAAEAEDEAVHLFEEVHVLAVGVFVLHGVCVCFGSFFRRGRWRSGCEGQSGRC